MKASLSWFCLPWQQGYTLKEKKSEGQIIFFASDNIQNSKEEVYKVISLVKWEKILPKCQSSLKHQCVG